MINTDLIRWRYMKPGDMLEARTKDGRTLLIGPILAIGDRPDKDKRYAPEKKYVLVPSLKDNTKRIDLPLKSVQAVLRNGIEVIRFSEDEQQSIGCCGCMQRAIEYAIPGEIFCSLHCQLEWIAKYYQDYPPGQNPIEKGEHINWANCDSCRKLNQIYCPFCVD